MQKEGAVFNDGGRPGSFNNKRKVNALHLWALTFWYPLCPTCLPLHPAQEEGTIVCGRLSLPLPLLSRTIEIFLQTAVVDDTLPPSPLVFCALRCGFYLTSRYWLKFYYRQGSIDGLPNNHNGVDEGATTRSPFPTPSGDIGHYIC
jgi:hypothetical protein